MDQDLIAYLDERFRENSEQFANLDERFRENSQQLASFREETERRFEETNRRFERVEESVRHTRILVEGVRGDVQLLAEGVSAFDGKLAAHRVELKEEIEEVKALLHVSYRDLNRRVG